MTDRPNVIVILADDMGFSDLGCFGGEISTPNLDRLAREGVRMNSFYNTARCSPSRASLLTGRYPHETGVGILNENDRPHGYPGDLSRDCPTIAEYLKTAGYTTCLSGKWHLSNDMNTPSDSWPTRRGFDHFYGITAGAGDYFHPRGLWRGEEKLEPPVDPGYYFTDAVAQHAADFVSNAASKGTPFFLYLAFTAPHWPLHAPEEDIERYAGVFDAGWDELRERRISRLKDEGILGEEAQLSERDPSQSAWNDIQEREWQLRRMAVYAAQIDRMDQAVGRVLAVVEEAGVEEDTVVMFLSDNGASAEDLPPEDSPHFYRRQPSQTLAGEPMQIGNAPDIWPGDESTYSSYGRAWANLSNTPFRYYKRWVHEGGIATPLIARWPAGGLATGSVVTTPFQLTDIVPTVLEATGVEAVGPSGVSMLDSWRADDSQGEHPLFWEHIGNCAIRDQGWKAVKTASGPWELYDLVVDRSELHNQAVSEPELLASLVEQWQEWADRVGVIPWATYGQPRT